MAGGGESEEGDYWPGYVDALTAMVKVLSFVMMLLAVAVFVLSQNVSKAAVEAIAKAAKIDVPPDADLKELTQKVMDVVEQRQAKAQAAPDTVDQPIPSEAKPTERAGVARAVNHEKKIEPDADSKRATVDFDGRSYKIDGAGSSGVATFVQENKLVETQAKIVVRAYALTTEGALSEARRIAYYRGMIVRKELIDRKIRAEDIRINVYDTSEKAEGQKVEIFTGGKTN